MGNKTISMTQLRRIIQLKIEGHSKRTIALMHITILTVVIVIQS